MKKTRFFCLLFVTIIIFALGISGCKRATSSSNASKLPYEALYLGSDLFVITKTPKESAVSLNTPLVAHFDDPLENQVGEVIALAFDELMESFPPQAKITASEKITVESKTHAGTFNLAYQLLQIHPDNTYLIDVRTVEEFESGHVPDSINIPLDQIDCTADSIPDLDSTLLIYCRSGHRTIAAAKALNEIGYKVIFDLGGISNYDGDLEKGR